MKLWSHDNIYNIIWVTWLNFIGDILDRNYDVKNFILKYLYFKKTWSNHFADIMKIVIIFIRTIFKDLNNVKTIENDASECTLYLYFWI